MNSKPGPLIWSHDTGRQIAHFDSCQLPMTCMPKIKNVAMKISATRDLNKFVNVLSKNQNILDQWVAKFPKVWGFARILWACRSSTTKPKPKATQLQFM